MHARVLEIINVLAFAVFFVFHVRRRLARPVENIRSGRDAVSASRCGQGCQKVIHGLHFKSAPKGDTSVYVGALMVALPTAQSVANVSGLFLVFFSRHRSTKVTAQCARKQNHRKVNESVWTFAIECARACARVVGCSGPVTNGSGPLHGGQSLGKVFWRGAQK
jgi:hypothetical protein